MPIEIGCRPQARCPRPTMLLAAALLCACCGDTTEPTPPQNCRYQLTPGEAAPCMVASQTTVAVATSPGCPWTTTTGATWITIKSGTSAGGSGPLTFAVADNWNAPRSGVVTVRHPSAASGTDVRVAQAGCYYSVTPGSIAVPAAGGVGTFQVMQASDPNTCGGPRQDACVWTAQTDVAWIALTTPGPQSGDQLVRFTVSSNTSGTAREGTISVRDKVVRVTQAAS